MYVYIKPEQIHTWFMFNMFFMELHFLFIRTPYLASFQTVHLHFQDQNTCVLFFFSCPLDTTLLAVAAEVEDVATFMRKNTNWPTQVEICFTWFDYSSVIIKLLINLMRLTSDPFQQHLFLSWRLRLVVWVWKGSVSPHFTYWNNQAIPIFSIPTFHSIFAHGCDTLIIRDLR